MYSQHGADWFQHCLDEYRGMGNQRGVGHVGGMGITAVWGTESTGITGEKLGPPRRPRIACATLIAFRRRGSRKELIPHVRRPTTRAGGRKFDGPVVLISTVVNFHAGLHLADHETTTGPKPILTATPASGFS